MVASPKQEVATLVGANIAYLRREKGWSQKLLAQKLGIGADSVSRFENGIIAPRLERLKEIADILGCELADLFLGAGHDKKQAPSTPDAEGAITPQAEIAALAARILELSKLV